MDGVLDYLPSPKDRYKFTMFDPANEASFKECVPDRGRLVAFVFKTLNDPKLGLLSYMKIYSGEIKARQTVYNASIDQEERVSQIMRMRAGEYQEAKLIALGDIAAVTGLKSTASGQTIVAHRGDMGGLIMKTLFIPKPVFMSSLVLQDEKHKEKLMAALDYLHKEDPSFSFEEDPDTSQLVVKGFGELHLEIMKDRLLSEYGIVATLSKLRVALRESIRTSGMDHAKSLERRLRDGIKYFSVSLSVEAIDMSGDKESAVPIKAGSDKVEMDGHTFRIYLEDNNIIELAIFKSDMSMSFYREFRDSMKKPGSQSVKMRNPEEFGESDSVIINGSSEPVYNIAAMNFENIYAMEGVLANAFSRGPLMGKHLINTKIRVTGGQFSKQKTNDIIVSMTTNLAVIELLAQCSSALMEPLMALEVSCPESCSQEIINDLLSYRNGTVKEVNSFATEKKTSDNLRTIIKGTVPLYMTIGYSTYLRSVSHVDLYDGRARLLF